MKKTTVILVMVALFTSLVIAPALASIGDGSNYIAKNIKIDKEAKAAVSQDTVKLKTDRSLQVKPERQQKVKQALEQAQSQVTGDYADTKSHWGSQAIKKAKALGLVKGYEDGTFRPEAPLSTLEATVLAVRLAETLGTDEDTTDTDEDTTETDENTEDAVSTLPDWSQDSVKKANALKIININRYHSQVQATRAQAAIMIAKALNLEPIISSEELPFPDVAALTPEDIGYLLALQEAGIIQGSPDGKFNPNSSLTRAEIATMLANIADQLVEEEDEEIPTTGDTLTANVTE